MKGKILVGVSVSLLVILVAQSFVPSYSGAFAPTLAFTSPLNISIDKGNAVTPFVTNSGNNFSVAWSEKGGIFFRTYDATTGVWSPSNVSKATELSCGCPKQSYGYPIVAVNGSNVYVVWGQNNASNSGNQTIFVATSHNYGLAGSFSITFKSTPFKNVNTERAEPWIAASKTDVYVSWSDWNTSPRTAYMFFSKDNGTNWQTANTSPSNGLMATLAEQQQTAWNADSIYLGDAYGAPFNSTYTINEGISWQVSPVPTPPGTIVSEPWIAQIGCNASVVWDTKYSGSTLYGAYTQDCGQTWQDFTPQQTGTQQSGTIGTLNTTSGNFFDPEVVMSGNYVYLEYLKLVDSKSQIFTRTLNLTSNIWSSPIAISGPAKSSWGYNIVAHGSDVFTTYGITTGTTTSGYIGYSFDNGKTWTSPNGQDVTNNPAGTSAAPLVNNEGSICIAISGSTVFVVWQQNSGLGSHYQIYFTTAPLL